MIVLRVSPWFCVQKFRSKIAGRLSELYGKILVERIVTVKKMSMLLAMSVLAPVVSMGGELSFESMTWFNEPELWSVTNATLRMQVTGQSDYWRVSHYGFTVDDGPFLYTERGGEFEAKIKVKGAYKDRFDQAGLMLRIDHENWIKAGIEFVDGHYNVSAVVTHGKSDWSVIKLEKPVDAIWIKAVRRRDAVELFYSLDDKEYTMMRNAWFQDNVPVRVGPVAAAPDGRGFEAVFSDFSVKHLPDARRLEWLEANKKAKSEE